MGKAKVSAAYPLLGVLLLVVVVGGVGWLFLRPGSATKGPVNVILISIDTCRADHLSCYGHPRKTTPCIDAFAREGILFTNVISPVPITLPAHCSMLTGANPPYHGAHDNITYQLAESNVTLAEALREYGYETAAFVASFVLDPRFGIAQGFNAYDAEFGQRATFQQRVFSERRAGDVNHVANAWLHKQVEEPFFLFLHYFDPHYPYDPPEPFASEFSNDPYTGEIAYTDRCIGELLDTLKRLGLYDSALILITSDHGEGLGDHSETRHSYFIYHTTTKVPLIVKLPERREPNRVDEVVGLIDIVPTILEYVGAPIPSEVRGESLCPYLVNKRRHGGERYIYSESLTPMRYGCSSLLGLETGKWKYIQASRPELYNLSEDPGESKNLVEAYPQQALLFKSRLKALLEEQTRITEDESALTLDQESLDRLEALGYVGGGTTDEAFEFETSKDDPKEFVSLYEKLARAMELFNQGVYAEARRLCGDILAVRPGFVKVYISLGKIAMAEGRVEEAVTHYLKVLEIDPEAAEVHNYLGDIRAQQARLKEAISHYREALRLRADAAADRENLDRALRRLGRIDPVRVRAHINLGRALFHLGRIGAAGVEFRKATEIDPRYAKAHYEYGTILFIRRKYEDAIKEFEEALRFKPNYPAARRALDAALAVRDRSTGP